MAARCDAESRCQRVVAADEANARHLPIVREGAGRIDSGPPHGPSPLRGTSPAERVPVQNTYKPSAFFNFLATQHGPHDFHGAGTARALERIPTPDLENEITPQGTHQSSAALGRRLDKKEFSLPQRVLYCNRTFLIGCRRTSLTNGRGRLPRPASCLVGIDAIVSDGLLAFGR